MESIGFGGRILSHQVHINIFVAGLTLHQLELPGPTRRHPDVPRVTGLYDIVQSLHRFLDLRLRQHRLGS